MSTKPKPQIIAVDFDGTVVTHDFPQVGNDVGAVQVLKALVESGHKLVLFTMRSDDPANTKNPLALTDAVNWFKDREIPLYGVNKNPQQHHWTSSPKVYADIYIDDAALGVPLLRRSTDKNERPFVNWVRIVYNLSYRGLFTEAALESIDLNAIRNAVGVE